MSKREYSFKGKVPGALISMLFGGLLMLVLVVSFNKSVDKKEEVQKKPIRHIKSEKKQQQKSTKPKPKPKPKRKKSTPKAPAPDISSMLGLSMDIPEFATENIAGDSSDLLDDIAEDAVMSEGLVDSKPKVLSRTAMEYPASAAKNGTKGYVIVNLLIAKDGTIEIAKVLESSPADVFDEAVLSGIRNWRFGPAKYKGKAVKVWAKQKISFN